MCTYLLPFDVSVTKNALYDMSAGIGLIRSGALVLYEVIIDALNGTATNLTIQDILPVGFSYLSHSVTSGTYASGSGIWDI